MAYESSGIRFLQKREETFTTEGTEIELFLKKGLCFVFLRPPGVSVEKNVFRSQLLQVGGERLSGR
jgi:hypothetical protein